MKTRDTVRNAVQTALASGCKASDGRVWVSVRWWRGVDPAIRSAATRLGMATAPRYAGDGPAMVGLLVF
jgi:hypothetical protein